MASARASKKEAFLKAGGGGGEAGGGENSKPVGWGRQVFPHRAPQREATKAPCVVGLPPLRITSSTALPGVDSGAWNNSQRARRKLRRKCPACWRKLSAGP